MTETTLHVAYVIESPYPSFVVREILALRRAGLRVTLLNSFRAFAEQGADAEALRRESYYLAPRFFGALVDLLAVLTRHPFRFVQAAAAVLRHRLPLRLLPLAAGYARIAGRLGIVHIHGVYATTPASVALLSARLAGLPYSFTAHAYDIYVPNPTFAWKLQQARFMTTISRFNRDLILSRWPSADPRKIAVAYLGVEAPPEPREARRALSEPRLLCVGSLEPRKGHTVLLDACAELLRSGRPVGLTLVGDGPLRASLEAQSRRLGLEGNVRFAGAKPHEEIGGQLAEADVFVLACVIAGLDQDGIPVALMEAMGAGVPVVSTRISGIPELVEDGVSGLVVEPGDRSGLAAAIGRVLDDAELRDRLSRQGRRRVLAAFDLDRNAREMRALFTGAETLTGLTRFAPRG